jgi:hypothetical protein
MARTASRHWSRSDFFLGAVPAGAAPRDHEAPPGPALSEPALETRPREPAASNGSRRVIVKRDDGWDEESGERIALRHGACRATKRPELWSGIAGRGGKCWRVFGTHRRREDPPASLPPRRKHPQHPSSTRRRHHDNH